MKLQRSVVFLVTFLSLNLVPPADGFWSCSNNVTGFPLMAPLIAGQWYEVARLPSSDVPACVEVTAPAAPVDDAYVLQVDFINNVNNQWRPEGENLSFPWNNNRTQNGIFDLIYTNGKYTIDVTFQLIATDYSRIALVCGYSGLMPKVSLVKVMARKRQVDADLIAEVDKLAANFNVTQELTWVEQSDRCNGAATTMPILAIAFAAILGISKML